MLTKTILDCSSEEARAFFMKASSYCNIDLPKYFDFQPLLDKCWKFAIKNDYSSIYDKNKRPGDFEKVNYLFYTNKDGRFSWRPMRIINPLVYAYLVKIITDDANWSLLQQRFNGFRTNNIKCISIPLINETISQTDNENTILNWWLQIEQKSIEYSLDYDYLLTTDISDCYGSVYTHSISWAIYGIDEAKHKRNNNNFGNSIDEMIMSMSYQQTNGIPQGSVLMDFLAELVLGYADSLLSDSINDYCKNNRNFDYTILRYRDDYRIFGKTQEDVVLIAKLLTEVLSKLNFKLNTQKTFVSQDIVRDSIKPDKLYWNSVKNSEVAFQKRLLIIHELSQKHPNSGSLVKALDRFYRDFHALDSLTQHISTTVFASIIVDIAYHNPKTYKIAIAILSKLFALEPDTQLVKDLYDKILNKFSTLPNVGYMYVWLQRLTLTSEPDRRYDEPLCQLVTGKSVSLWDNSWLKIKKENDFFKNTPIVDDKKMNDLPMVIEPDEVLTFNVY